MAPETQSLLDAALKLPETERALLVGRLLETLPPEEELFQGLERQRAEVEEGRVTPIPWSDVWLTE